jgi:DNA-binding beta-propeller fold protein YncE
MWSRSAWRQAAIGCGIVGMVLVADAFAQSGFRILKKFPILCGEETWDYIAIDEAGRRLFLAHDTQVEVLSADTGKLLGTIADTKGAHATVLVPEFNRGFITNGDNATVTMFDLGTLKRLSEIRTGELPDSMIYDPSTKRLFSMNTVGRSSTVINAKDGSVAGTVDLDGKPEHAAADGSGHVFVNLKDKAIVARVDSHKLAVDRRWPIADCDRPTSMAMDRQTRRLFVGCRNLALYVVDADNGRVITHLPIGDNVDSTVFDPETGLVFTSTEDAKITVMHEDGPDSFRVVETVTTAPGAKTMVLDPKTHQLFVPYGEVEKTKAEPGSTGGKVDMSGMRKRVVPNTFGVLVVGR